jgi:hypothetical protein
LGWKPRHKTFTGRAPLTVNPDREPGIPTYVGDQISTHEVLPNLGRLMKVHVPARAVEIYIVRLWDNFSPRRPVSFAVPLT